MRKISKWRKSTIKGYKFSVRKTRIVHLSFIRQRFPRYRCESDVPLYKSVYSPFKFSEEKKEKNYLKVYPLNAFFALNFATKKVDFFSFPRVCGVYSPLFVGQYKGEGGGRGGLNWNFFTNHKSINLNPGPFHPFFLFVQVRTR